jgi:hypothetical protein
VGYLSGLLRRQKTEGARESEELAWQQFRQTLQMSEDDGGGKVSSSNKEKNDDAVVVALRTDFTQHHYQETADKQEECTGAARALYSNLIAIF